jgi:hypothetical protein
MPTYPVTIPNPDWLYICLTNTGTVMESVGLSGIVDNPAIMSELAKDLTAVNSNGNRIMQSFYEWVRAQTNVVSKQLNTITHVISPVSYPVTIPNPEWLYFCQVFANSRTPNMKRVAISGIVATDQQMLFLESEVTGVLQNGNPSMCRFYDWIRANRSFKDVDDPINDVVGL